MQVKRRTRQVALLWSILILIIIIVLSVGVGFLGYWPAISYGTSMEPTVRGGDVLLMKDMDHTKLRTGDIVVLQHPSKGPIAHRIVSIKSISQHDLLIQTRGDAKQVSEWWLVTAGEKVAVAIVHVRFFGHALEFIKTVPGMILLLASALVLLVVLTKLFQSSQLDSSV